MKKESTSFFGTLFGAKGKAPAPAPTPVVLTPTSQPHVLRQRMQEEQLTHGKTVTASLSPVRLERTLQNEAVLYFCPMKKIEVLEVVAEGDGGHLPAAASLHGITLPASLDSGLYRLCNVSISSNGTLQVTATEQTTWEKIERFVV